MDSTLRNVLKFLFVTTIVVIFSATAFVAGFGVSYLLTERDAMPAWSAIVPTATPFPAEGIEDVEPVEPAENEPTPLPLPTSTPIPLPTPANDDEEAFQIFWEVWDLVQRNFYGELPDMQQVAYAAIHGMLGTLDDDHTAFIEPEIATIIAEDATGEFEGIGAFVDLDEEGKVELVGIFEDGPAEKAGLLTGDRVVKVDGVSIIGKTLYEAINLIRGPANSDVVLLIEREEEPELFDVTVTRARLEIPIIEVEMRDDGIGYIHLHEFSATAHELTRDGLEELLAQNPAGIVFDLRNNPGGWLEQAIKVGDLFLDDGVIVIERWSDGREQQVEADPGDVGEDVPLVVLVNGGSASASEIVAGALQDQGRAILIGELTFGKGSVQRPFTLSDGSELRVTSALWFTPNDQAIHGQGIAPDIEVPWPVDEDLGPEEDPQLERAVEYLLTGE